MVAEISSRQCSFKPVVFRYDRNLLEIAESSPQYVRCKPKRMDTFEEESVVDEDEEQEESDVVSTRYQSHGSLVSVI